MIVEVQGTEQENTAALMNGPQIVKPGANPIKLFKP